MSILGNLQVDTTAERSTPFESLESGIYNGKIKQAYFIESKGGALGMALTLELENGSEHRETIYFTNRNKQTFYTRNNKNYDLPGYALLNDLALFTTGKRLEQGAESVIQAEVYDYDTKSTVKKEVKAPRDMLDKPVCVGILKKEENRTELNSSTNKYEPTNEKITVTNIDAAFHPKTHLSVPELIAKETEPKAYNKWVDKNQGKTKDNFKPVNGVKTGSPSGGVTFGGTNTSATEAPSIPEDNPFM